VDNNHLPVHHYLLPKLHKQTLPHPLQLKSPPLEVIQWRGGLNTIMAANNSNNSSR
jgi:hypothetical protein